MVEKIDYNKLMANEYSIETVMEAYLRASFYHNFNEIEILGFYLENQWSELPLEFLIEHGWEFMKDLDKIYDQVEKDIGGKKFDKFLSFLLQDFVCKKYLSIQDPVFRNEKIMFRDNARNILSKISNLSFLLSYKEVKMILDKISEVDKYGQYDVNVENICYFRLTELDDSFTKDNFISLIGMKELAPYYRTIFSAKSSIGKEILGEAIITSAHLEYLPLSVILSVDWDHIVPYAVLTEERLSYLISFFKNKFDKNPDLLYQKINNYNHHIKEYGCYDLSGNFEKWSCIHNDIVVEIYDSYKLNEYILSILMKRKRRVNPEEAESFIDNMVGKYGAESVNIWFKIMSENFPEKEIPFYEGLNKRFEE